MGLVGRLPPSALGPLDVLGWESSDGGSMERAGGLGWISKDKRGTWKALTKRRLGNAPSNDEPPTRLLVFIGTDGHRLLPLLLPNSPPFSDGH